MQAVLQAPRQAAPGQLPTRQQRHRQVDPVEAHRLPVRGAWAQAGIEHPVGQGLEQAAVLGERHEALGADQPELRMGPAEQRRDAERAGPDAEVICG